MQSIIKKIVWGCLLIVPFIAFHVSDGRAFDVFNLFGSGGMFFPFISGKNIIFRVLVEIALAGWAVLALYDSSYRINVKKSPIMIAYSLFIIVLLFADLFGVGVEKSMWSNFERMEGFVGHIHFFAYFFVLTVMVRNISEWQKMWKFFIAGNILVLLHAFGQLLGSKTFIFSKIAPELSSWFSSRFAIHMSESRLDATIGNSAYFAVFCLMYIFIAAILWSQSDKNKKNWFYPTLIFANIIGVLYSGTRGTMIALAVGGFVTLGILAYKEKGKIRKIFAVSLISFAVIVSSIFLLKNTPLIQSFPVLSRIASISPNDITGASRLSMWKISYEAWKERPILGYGQDNFSYVFARKFLPDMMCNLEPWYDRSHNVFFDWLVAAGVLGLITYLSLYFVTLSFIWKKKDHDMPLLEKAIITGMLVGYFIHNFFVFDNLTSYILFFATLAYVTVRTKENGRGHESHILNKDQLNLLVVPAIGITLLIILYYVNYRPVAVNKLIIRAMSISEYAKTMPFADAVKLQMESFVDAIAMNTLGSLEAREQFLQMSVRMGQVKIPDDMAQGDKQLAAQSLNNTITATRKEIESSFENYKDDVRMLSIYGMFYNGVGDAVTAEKVLTIAHTLAPNKQLLTYELIRAYLMQKKSVEAYNLAKETYDLSIDCRDAVKWYMISASYAGKFKEARAYALSKGQDVGLDPEVIAGVLSSGQTTLAVELLQELKKKDPSIASQIDEYIKQLLAPKK